MTGPITAEEARTLAAPPPRPGRRPGPTPDPLK